VGPPQSSGRWVARLSPATPSRALARPLTRVPPGGRGIEIGVGWVSVQCSRDVAPSSHAHVYIHAALYCPALIVSAWPHPPSPQVTLEAGKWRRFRIVHSGTIATLEITLPGCDVDLLAKDGVYLRANPRRVTTVFVVAGARADVAVRCPAAGFYTMASGADAKRKRRSRSLLQGGGGGGGGGGPGNQPQPLPLTLALTLTLTLALALT
jgi:hypothetical protein